jgi:putative DNA primase/helicase
MSVPANFWVANVPAPPASVTSEQRRAYINVFIQSLRSGKKGSQELYAELQAVVTPEQAFDIATEAVNKFNASLPQAVPETAANSGTVLPQTTESLVEPVVEQSAQPTEIAGTEGVSNPMLASALQYQRAGSSVFLIGECSKQPDPVDAPHGFKSSSNDTATITKWWTAKPTANIGVDLGRSNMTVLDFDSGPAPIELGLPPTLTVQTARGFHYYFFGIAKQGNMFWNGQKIGDLKSDGGYVLGASSVHPDGPIYTIVNNMMPAPLPLDIVARLRQRSGVAEVFTKNPEGWLDEPFIHHDIDNQLTKVAGYYIGTKNISDPKELYALLIAKLEENGCFEPDGVTPFSWNEDRVKAIAEDKVRTWEPGLANPVAMSIEKAVVASSGGDGVAVERPKLLTEVGNARRLIETYGKNIRFSSEDGTWLFFGGKVWQLDRHGIYIDDLMKRVLITMQNEAGAIATISPELHNKLTKKFEPKMIYDKSTRQWNQTPLTVEEKAAVEAYKAAKEYEGWAVTSESSRAINGAVDQAKSEPGMTIANSALDNNINVCNVLNGTFDFNAETAGINFRPHLREDYCTRMVNAEYIQGVDCPQFKKFFTWMFPDPEVRTYLQKFFGLCLTGILTRKIIVLWGEGRNGKGTLMKTLQGIFGEVLSKQKEQLAKAYSVTVSVATFSVGQGDQAGGARADLMPLKGSRLIVASEVNRGSKNKRVALDMARLKEMTGGDETVARGLYQADETRFTPQGKIVIQTNNMPDVADDSDGAWERIKKVNCASVVTNEEMDEALHEKLLQERSGILNWLLEGLALYFKDGLGEDPAAITEATEEFRGTESHMARFVEDSCEVGKGVTATTKTPTSMVYSSYKYWCQQNGENADTQRALTMYLQRRHNIITDRTATERLLCRIRLKREWTGGQPGQLATGGQLQSLAATEGMPEGANAVAHPRSNNVDLRSPGQF